MANSEELADSYKAGGVSFDPTNDPSKDFDVSDTDVQKALERAKAVTASTTAEGLVERATDTEAGDMTDTVRYVTPAHLGQNIPDVIYDPVNHTKIPVEIFAGTHSSLSSAANSLAADAPKGSIITWNERYTVTVGYGNGSTTQTRTRRRSMIKSDNTTKSYTYLN